MTLSILELRSISILGDYRTRIGNEWDDAIESGDGIDTSLGNNHIQFGRNWFGKGMSGKDNGINELGGGTDLLHNDPPFCAFKIDFAANLVKK
jgi:hypothetical protein